MSNFQPAHLWETDCDSRPFYTRIRHSFLDFQPAHLWETDCDTSTATYPFRGTIAFQSAHLWETDCDPLPWLGRSWLGGAFSPPISGRLIATSSTKLSPSISLCFQSAHLWETDCDRSSRPAMLSQSALSVRPSLGD